MATSVQQLINTRTSINHFQPNHPLNQDTINTLVNLATKAPTAYNMQNWRFIAVQSEDAKRQLKSAAFNQQKIIDASVAFIICGQLDGYQQLQQVLQSSVSANIIEQKIAESWVAQATTTLENNIILQRDEAIRSASLAAMTLMLAAQDMGLGSCALGGFDAVKITQEFSLSNNELPVIIIVIGYPTHNNWQQKSRRLLSEILTII